MTLTRQKGRAPSSVRIRSAVLAPARAPPSAAPAGSLRRLYNCANPSAEVPAAYPPSSAVPRPAISQLSAAFPRAAFVPPFSAGSRLAHVGISPKNTFRAEIMPGNTLARVHVSPRDSPLDSATTCLSDACVLFVLLTSNVPRSFYSAEYEILTVF